jgi:hypothetical protein
VTLLYAGQPFLNEVGGEGDFDPLEEGAVVELHTFYVAGTAALAEVKRLQAGWLAYCGTVVGSGATVDDLRAAFSAFHAASVGEADESSDGAAQEAMELAVEWQTYARDRTAFEEAKSVLQSRLVKKGQDTTQLEDQLPSAPRRPASRVSVPVRQGFATRATVQRAVEGALPGDAARAFFSAVALCGVSSRGAAARASHKGRIIAMPPANRLIHFVQFLRGVTVLMTGNRRARNDFIMDGLTHATPPQYEGLVHRQQIAEYLAHMTSMSGQFAAEIYGALPSFRSEWAPKEELASQLEEPSSRALQRLKGLRVVSDVTTPRWADAVFFGNARWASALRVATTISILAVRESIVRAAGGEADLSQSRSLEPAGSPREGSVLVRPEWRAALPWLPANETTIPQKTHVFLERKYLHQRVFALETGTMVDELWSASLATRPEVGSSVVELCPDVMANLRALANVTAKEIADDLGIGNLTAGLLGGVFTGLRKPRAAFTNYSLAAAHAGYRPAVSTAAAADGTAAAPRPLSQLYETSSGRFLVQFFDGAGIHKLLSVLPKYHRHVYDNSTSSMVPRLLGAYAMTYAADSNAAAASSVPRQQQQKLVFFSVMLSPASRVIETFGRVRQPDVVTHVSGDFTDAYTDSPPRGVGVWTLDTAAMKTVGQSACCKFDISDELRADVVAAVKQDAAFLANGCGITHFSCTLHFYLNDPHADGASSEATSRSARTMDSSAVGRQRRWLAVRRRGVFSSDSGFLRQSVYPSGGRHGVMMAHRRNAPAPVPGQISRADESSQYLHNLSKMSPTRNSTRPLVRWSVGMPSLPGYGGAGEEELYDDGGIGYAYNAALDTSAPNGSPSAFLPRRANHHTDVPWPEPVPIAKPRSAQSRIRVEIAPPAAWTCVVCGTVNARQRNAAMVKPCHVCFGLNERLESGGSIPVTTSAAEYAALLKAANAARLGSSRSPSPNRTDDARGNNRARESVRMGGTNVFGLESDDMVLQAPVEDIMRRRKGLRPNENDDDVLGDGGLLLGGRRGAHRDVEFDDDEDDNQEDADASLRNTSASNSPQRLRPLPGPNRTLLSQSYGSGTAGRGTKGVFDNFLRLAGAPSHRERLLNRAADYQCPGTICVPAMVEGRPDVTGHLLIFITDFLGLPLTAHAAETSDAIKYGRSFIANVLDALGDDFL